MAAASFTTPREPLGVITAPAFWSSHWCISSRRVPKPWSAAILIRTGNRRSASAIINLDLPAILFPLASLFLDSRARCSLIVHSSARGVAMSYRMRFLWPDEIDADGAHYRKLL